MIRCGVDVVSVERILGAIQRFGERFAGRILTPSELRAGKQRKDFHLFLAGRFAAKEALYKALDIPDLTWQRVEIRHEGRRPVVFVDGTRLEGVDLSISHEDTVAIAMVVRLDNIPGDNQHGS